MTSYYPTSPQNISKELTSLTSSYKLKAFLAIMAIILFFLLYTGLVIGLGYLVYYAFIYEMGYINKLTILLKIGAIAGSIMLFVFTLKFIFKLKNHNPTNRIKLKKEEHPELWGFIHKICEETGAPKPKNIYVDPDVNAYVSYTNVWLSLFLPVKKNLTIGLGLTDSLNLSEFKAVMSHEFGHFAQKSMKIGSYINSANTIIHDMIYSRDRWDNILDQWRESDIRLSAAAWVITPIIWIIRQVLALFYQFLNIMYSQLSREMEFNADKVAISTSGSDAIISALWKLDSGFEKWDNTINNAYLAKQKKVHTKNLYTHNNLAIKRTEKEQLEKINNLPNHKNGGKNYFLTSENSKVGMYASHPPNDMRQENAKKPFIECDIDERSPWILFGNPEKLKEEMTSLIYKQYLNLEPKEFSNIEVFENFIAQETKGKHLLEEYQNTFESRFLHIEEEKELVSQSTQIETIDKSALTKLKQSLTTLMKPVVEIESLMQKAVQISQGTIQDKSFAFNGIDYKKKNIEEGYNKLITERESLFNTTFKEWDTNFCTLHLALAKKYSKFDKLLKIYNQHRSICNIYKGFTGTKATILDELTKLQSKGEVDNHEVNRFGNRVKDLHFGLNNFIDTIDEIEFIPMSNIDDADEFKEAIIEGKKFKQQTGMIFENGGFDIILNEIELAINHCQRLEQKSIGLILMFHDDLLKNLTT